MKKLLALVLTVMMLAAAIVPTSAADQIVGAALYTEIVAYIDGYPIRSYNINNNTYIMVEDLANYGYSVTWDGAAGRLVISPNRIATPDKYTTTYKAETVDPALLGKKCADIYQTTVTTWYGATEITGYNIGGQTLIWLDDFAKVSGAGLLWVPAEKALKMTTVNKNESVDPPATQQPILTNPFDKIGQYIVQKGVKKGSGNNVSYELVLETKMLGDSVSYVRSVLYFPQTNEFGLKCEHNPNSIIGYLTRISAGPDDYGVYSWSYAETYSGLKHRAMLSGDLYSSTYTLGATPIVTFNTNLELFTGKSDAQVERENLPDASSSIALMLSRFNHDFAAAGVTLRDFGFNFG